MPVEFSLEISAERPMALPFFTGYISRGLLLHMLRIVDPSVSASLHEPDRVKPYSVTPLYFRSMGRFEGGYILSAGSPCRVSFRFLDDGLASIFLKYFYGRDSLLIQDTAFTFGSISVRSEGYRDLLDGVRDTVSSITLRFLTPTYLAVLGSDYHHMFPDQGKVFTSLMRLWNTFSDGRRFTEEEQKAYQGWLTEKVGVSKYKLQTRMAYMRDKKASGFTGWITYELGADDKWNKVTQTLARYAEYSNIGGNRTGGFGVTKTNIEG